MTQPNELIVREIRDRVPDFEIRRDADGNAVIRGYASVFNHVYDVGGMFDEVVRPGAFARALAENQDVRALWNHNSDNVIGRTASGTLELEEDDVGLRVQIDPPKSAASEIEAIERGDVREMSFGFRVRSETWTEREDDKPLRELIDVDLFDVSPVAYPASNATSVAVSARSAESVLREYLESRDPGDSPESNDDDPPVHRTAVRRRRIEVETAKRKE